MHTTDDHLLNRWILNRDAQAFKALTSKYCGMVYGTSLRILRNPADAEEVTQECFAALAKSTRGPQGSMGAWLHRIATYQALNRRRADQRRREREALFAASRSDKSEVAWDDISQFIDQSIEALPEKIRIAVFAHFIEDESVTAIAAREGVTHSAISQRLQKGIELIRDRMRQNGIPIGGAALAAMLGQEVSAATAVPPSLTSDLGKRAIAGSTTTNNPSPLFKFSGRAFIGAAVTVGAALVVLTYTFTPASDTANAAATAPAGETVETAASEPARSFVAPDQPRLSPEPPTAPASVAVPMPARALPQPRLSSWKEVVDAYTAHQDRIRRIRFDYEHSSKGSYFWYDYAPEPGYREFFERGSVITDGTRCYMVQKRWGHTFGGDPVPADRANDCIFVYDGNTYLNHLRGDGEDAAGNVQINPNAMNSPIRNSAFHNGRIYLLFSRYPGGLMIDMPLVEGWRMEEILYNAKRIALRPALETVQGAECYVVDADTSYGDFTVWFNPERDFNISQSLIDMGPGDIYERHPLMFGTSARYEYVVERFERVEGLWVPMEANYRQIARLRGGNGHDYTHHHKRSNIKVLAEGEDEGAYVIQAKDIANGAWLMDPVGTIRRKGDPRWVWQTDQFVLTYDQPQERTPRDAGQSRGFGGGMIAGEASN